MTSSRQNLLHFFGRWLAISLVGFAISGCEPAPPPPAPTGAAVRVKADNAPPLKILLVEAEPLQAELALRWQSFSEQGLQIQSMSRREVATQEVSTVDVVIYPGNLMGTLITGDWIAPVPNQVRDRIGGWGMLLGSEGSETTTSISWPSRWRSLSLFGSKPMAVPLGAPSWVAATRSLDGSALRKLHERISSNQLTAESSKGLWDEFLSKAETALEGTRAERERELQQYLQELTPEAKRFLASRYLWLVSSTESRYRGMFDMYKLLSRWNQPEFTRAALHFRRLALLEPSTIFASPTKAWDSVVEGDAVFGLGWPRTDNEQRLAKNDAKQPLDLIPIVWNDASGLMASMGRRTRQSANATEFLIWLGSEDQRSSFQSKTPGVEVLEIDQDRNRVREDYREYQTLQRLESASLTLDFIPRFFEADLFLRSLEEALVDILKAPETAEARMAQCRQECDALVDRVGREKLRSSIEAAIGYSK